MKGSTSSPADGVIRRLVRGGSLLLAAASGTWALYLASFGGVDAVVSGIRITANEPLRPLLITSIALTLYILSSGVPRFGLGGIRTVVLAVRRIDQRLIALALALTTFIVGVVYCTTAASGADAYGYVSQADLWIKGELRVPQPWVEQAQWPSRRWGFAPLGYRPIEEEGVWGMVPTYSPGLPLLMAAAKIVAGHCAMFWVVPFSGGLLVLATYGLGRRLGAGTAGLIAAVLVATSPTFLFMLMWPMTDVPVAAAWAVAIYFLLGRSAGSAAAAGIAAAVAILIRPNLVFAGGLTGIWYVLQALRDRAHWTRHARHAAIYAACASLGVVATGAINAHLYGSPFTSGYGGLSGMFGQDNVVPNLRNYFVWLVHSQTILPAIGLAVLVVPLKRVWPGVTDRAVFVPIALFVVALWAQYVAYLVFEDWWYLRFLLSIWPFMMLGLASAGLALVRLDKPVLTALVVVVLAGLVVRDFRFSVEASAFQLWEGERRYVSIGKIVRSMTPDNSVVLALQHSGSLRYYAGRTTIRFDNIDEEWLDRTIAWIGSHGYRPYLLAEDWELPQFNRQFASQEALTLLKRPPVFVYKGPATILLYDLLPDGDAGARTQMIVETFEDLRCVPPAPTPVMHLK